jgi:hypothetical protein
LAAGKF